MVTADVPMPHESATKAEKPKEGQRSGMSETERVINDLNVAKHMLCNPQMLASEMNIRIGQAITNAIALLKEREAEPICKIIFDIPYYFCGDCKAMLNMYATKANYCSACGKRVAWEGGRKETK